MSPTTELRWLEIIDRDRGSCKMVLQQKWVQHHIPTGMTEAPFDWRDVPIVKDKK